MAEIQIAGKQIIELPEKTELDGDEVLVAQDGEGTKQINLSTAANYINSTIELQSQNTNSNINVPSTSLVWKNFIDTKVLMNTNLFDSWESDIKIKLEQFICSLKITVLNSAMQVNSVTLTDINIFDTYIRINIRCNDNQWVMYNYDIPKDSGIKDYQIAYGSFKISLVLNWDYLPNNNITNVALNIINFNSQPVFLTTQLQDYYVDAIVLKNLFYNVFDVKSESILNYLRDSNDLQITFDNGKLHIIAQGKEISRYNGYFDDIKNLSLNSNHTYAFYYDVTVNNFLDLHNNDGILNFVFHKYGIGFTTNIRFTNETKVLNKQRLCGVTIATAEQTSDYTNIYIELRKYNNTGSVEKILDLYFNFFSEFYICL